MNKSLLATAIFAISTVSPYALADEYLPGQPIPRSESLLERVSDAFFPGFRRQSDDRYGNAFSARPGDSYAFVDELNRRDENLKRAPGVSSERETPVGNVFNLRF